SGQCGSKLHLLLGAAHRDRRCSVGAADWMIVLVAWQLVLARFVAVDQTLDGASADQVLLHNLLDIFRLHAPVPDILGIDDDHGAMAALVEAATVIDAHTTVEIGLRYQLLEPRMDAQSITIHLGTIFAAGADEDVPLEDMPCHLGNIRYHAI